MSKKKTWFNLKHIQVSQKTRDSVIDFVKEWSGKTEIPRMNLINWTGISKSKYYNWNSRYGKANKDNRETPRDFYLESWEKEKIVFYYLKHQSEGYRRLSFKMVDADVVASSPSTVYRVLKSRGYMNRWNSKPTKKGTGFVQPSRPHEHWHIDITYINVRGTFYYLLTILDGYSRFVVHWEVRECMKESDVEIILQRAHEKFPDETPRIISDNGPQFIAKDFKEFIRVSGMTHVRTAPYYPQSNGKLERYNGTLKKECIRVKTPLNLEEVRHVVDEFVNDYNTKRLHSAIGYITPVDKLEGREKEIFEKRAQKFKKARERRKASRQNSEPGLHAVNM